MRKITYRMMKDYSSLRKGQIVYFNEDNLFSNQDKFIHLEHKIEDGHMTNGYQRILWKDLIIYCEEINDNQMPELVAGNIVEDFNNCKGLIVQTSCNNLLIYWCNNSTGAFTSQCGVNNLLPGIIKKIYRGVTNERRGMGLSTNINIKQNYFNDELIWENEEQEKIVELTLEQIADKFNINVNNLKIKK